jgi:hypothetical protein
LGVGISGLTHSCYGPGSGEGRSCGQCDSVPAARGQAFAGKRAFGHAGIRCREKILRDLLFHPGRGHAGRRSPSVFPAHQRRQFFACPVPGADYASSHPGNHRRRTIFRWTISWPMYTGRRVSHACSGHGRRAP